MKKFLSLFGLLLGFSFLFSVIGCEVGMGQAIDLEAPVITVTSPVTLANIRTKSFSITGTCSDNIAVTSVVIQDKETGDIYANADINGNDWVANVTLEEGEKTLLCIANDAIGNQSAKSIKTMIYLVDETAPEGLSWYVDRGNNVQTALKEKEELQSLNYDDFKNIDIPQNESFKIYGRFYDAMSIDTIRLELWEEERKIVEKTVSAENIQAGTSIYSPCFEFTSSDMSSLDNEQHFLKLKYYSKDEHGNEETRELPYMLWWPDSDNPRIGFSQVTDNKMRVNIGSAIPIHFFDDDLLSEIRAVLVDSVNLNNIKNNPDGIQWTIKETNIDSESKRDVPVQIYAPQLPGDKKLVVYAKDKNGNVTVKTCDVEITDASKPLLFIESPEEHAIPTIKNESESTFEIKGYSLDTSGSRSIKIAYVPGKTGTEAETRGKALIKGTVTPENGEFTKSYILGSSTDDNGWKKQVFTFEFKLLEDFKNGEISYAKEDKFFEFLLTDLDNNEVWKQMVIAGDKTAPTINIVSPETDMYVYDYVNGEENFEIKFNASKTSGLGVDENKYKVNIVWNDENNIEYSSKKKNIEFVTENGKKFAKVTIPKSEIASKKDINLQPKIMFEAYDVLGNFATERRNIVLSPLPQLQKILSGNMNGTFKKGDVINFQAVFSDAVKVAGTPKLVLKYSENDKNPKYADYTGTGNRTDTLVFSFTVPEDAECEKLICDYTNPIVLATGGAITEISIKTASTGEGNAYLTTLSQANTLSGKEFKLDGKLPTIKNITVAPESSSIKANADSNYYMKANEVIKASVKFSEKVNISGNPVLHLYGGSSEKGIDFTLQSISDDTIVFTHKITEGKTPEGTLIYNFAKAFTKATSGSNLGYVEEVLDVAGNPLKLPLETDKTNEKGNKNLVIDTTKPSSAPVINIAGGTNKKYNAAQTLTLSGEEGAKIEFSPNGGVSWYEYTNPVSLTSTGFTLNDNSISVSGGEYTLKTRQTDKAGNVSDESTETHFTINSTFPSITALVVSKPDGNYAEKEEIIFKVTYSAKIKAPDATSMILSFMAGNEKRTVNVTPVNTTEGSERLEFVYKVSSNDECSGISITGITYSKENGKKPVDLYGNSPATDVSITSSTGIYTSTKRIGIILDGKAPMVSTYVPAKDAIVTNGNEIKLTFSEKVEKESGIITLRRKSTADEPWRIPPVLTEEEFNSVYNELELDTDKETLIKMDGGAPKLFEKNGQPLGPYKRITHGLIGEDGSSSLPDTSTKFVLDFNIGIKDGFGYLADGTKVLVSDLRAVFEKAGYNKQEIEVTDASVTVSGKEVTIKFPKTLEDGREWELYIEPGSFRDETGNSFGGLGYTVSENTVTMNTNSTYSFWSDKVAKPWIRVDRYSHGYAAIEPTVTGTGTNATYDSVKIISSYGTKSDATNTVNPANTAPSGYARVRIDCETPGATIRYGWNGKITGTCDESATKNNLWSSNTSLTDLDPKNGTINKTYNGYFVVGDGDLRTARRDFVKAQCVKTGFETSDYGYEGVFKTVVTAYANNNANYMKMEGGSGAGGMPSYGGFPLRDAEEGKGHDKGCYKIESQKFVWQTYEILSTWWALPYNQNYTSTYYYCGYGYNNHIYQPAFYSGSQNGTEIDAGYTEITVDMVK